MEGTFILFYKLCQAVKANKTEKKNKKEKKQTLRTAMGRSQRGNS